MRIDNPTFGPSGSSAIPLATTASFAHTAVSASYFSGSISNAANAERAITASFATTASNLAGRVPAYFYVTFNDQLVPNNVTTVISSSALVVTNTYTGSWSNTTGLYTVPVSGYYEVKGQIGFGDFTPNVGYVNRFLGDIVSSNLGTVARTIWGASSTARQETGIKNLSAIVFLSASTQISLQVSQILQTAATYTYTNNVCSLSVNQLPDRI
jgi:hypothetical protein